VCHHLGPAVAVLAGTRDHLLAVVLVPTHTERTRAGRKGGQARRGMSGLERAIGAGTEPPGSRAAVVCCSTLWLSRLCVSYPMISTVTADVLPFSCSWRCLSTYRPDKGDKRPDSPDASQGVSFDQTQRVHMHMIARGLLHLVLRMMYLLNAIELRGVYVFLGRSFSPHTPAYALDVKKGGVRTSALALPRPSSSVALVSTPMSVDLPLSTLPAHQHPHATHKEVLSPI
jgi:hypothetical protein